MIMIFEMYKNEIYIFMRLIYSKTDKRVFKSKVKMKKGNVYYPLYNWKQITKWLRH